MEGESRHRRVIDRCMAGVAAGGLLLVIYLAAALSAGGDESRDRGEGQSGSAASVRAGPENAGSPPRAPRAGSGPHDLAGTVTDAGGKPVAGVWVTAELEAAEEARRVTPVGRPKRRAAVDSRAA